MMQYCKNSLFLLCCLWASIPCWAQFTLHGYVLNAQDSLALPYANVSLQRVNIGTITGSTGKFTLKTPDTLQTDNLIVSFLGFETNTLQLNFTEEDSLLIYLNPQYFDIKEVIISPVSATEIITKALDAIPENYPKIPTRITAFYKETVSENNEISLHTEAVLQIYKGAYSDKRDRDRLKIEKGRVVSYDPTTPLLSKVDFINGPYEALMADVAKYPKSFIQVPEFKFNFLNPGLFSHYVYHLHTFRQDGQELYYIRFEPRKRTTRGIYEGELIIDKKSFAIVSMYYTITGKDVAKCDVVPYDTREYLEHEGYITTTVNYEAMITYRQYENTWYYHTGMVNYSFLYQSTEVFELVENKVELVVTDISTSDIVPIKPRDYLLSRSSLVKQIHSSEDDFWENYNYIDE